MFHRTLIQIALVVSAFMLIASCSAGGITRQARNESAAVASLGGITRAEVNYLSSSGGRSYGTISQLVSAGLLDSRFISNNGVVSGYRYLIKVSGTDYTAEAIPASTSTGRYGYYSTPDGVVRYSTGATLAPSPADAGKAVP